MPETLSVLTGKEVAGTITRLSGGRLRLDYAEEYRAREDPVPLSLSLPTQVRSHSDAAVTPWLWGLLPESDAVLRRWARQFHTSTASPFSLLSTPVGEDCAGAFRFVPPERAENALHRAGTVEWLTEAEVGQRLRELRQDATAWLGRDFTGQFSLAGAQAKTALLLQDGRWGVPSGATPTTHILKPAIAGLDDHDLNEHLCLDAGRRIGLTVARTRVAEFDGESAIVVERYDRVPTGSGIVRIHQEDLCQALGIHPDRKYQSEGGPGPADVAALLHRVMPPRVADDAVWRFADALAWNWLIAGTDAHAKNYSLLIGPGQVRLAPLYDIASALPYGTHEKTLRLAMKLGGDYRLATDRNPWRTAAADLGLEAVALTERVRDLARRAPAAFAAAAAAPGVTVLSRTLPARLTDLVAERATRCLGALDAGYD
jgi:serine/threonine-protein kinase HipA